MTFIGEFFAGLKLLWEIVQAAKSIAGFIESNKNELWFQESAQVFQKMKEAKTNEEKKDIVRNLAHLLRGI